MKARGGFGQPSPERAAAAVTAMPRRARTVIVVHAVFKYSLDKAKQDILRINKAFGKVKRHPVLHGDRQCGWVCETHYTADQLMGLLREAFSADCVANAWAFTPGADVASVLPLDPFTDRVREAWSNVRDWNRGIPRKAPETFFATSRPIPGGTVATRILDDHPLQRQERAA
jgi:hypothetical protein